MPSANSALLAHSANYRQIVELRPCDAVPALMELRILSEYLDGKHPGDLQVRFRAMVERPALQDLQRCLRAVLEASDEPARHGQVD